MLECWDDGQAPYTRNIKRCESCHVNICCFQMVELCSKLEKDVAAIDGTNAGLEARGADLVNRASDLHARIDVCGARARQQVRQNVIGMTCFLPRILHL